MKLNEFMLNYYPNDYLKLLMINDGINTTFKVGRKLKVLTESLNYYAGCYIEVVKLNSNLDGSKTITFQKKGTDQKRAVHESHFNDYWNHLVPVSDKEWNDAPMANSGFSHYISNGTFFSNSSATNSSFVSTSSNYYTIS